jgi:hypothetical protein
MSSFHRTCCCPGVGQISCPDYCACLPETATVNGINIDVVWETKCGSVITANGRETINITNVDLIIDVDNCRMINVTGTVGSPNGAWSYDYIERNFTGPRTIYNGGPLQGACSPGPCVQNCDEALLCKTFRRWGSGVNPSIAILCDNPCQLGTITDAFSRLEWFINGNAFNQTLVHHNPYPIYAACRYDPCDPNDEPDENFSGLGFGYSGNIWGNRGCLTKNTFATFNACDSIPALQNVFPPQCTQPPQWPNCYLCKNGTVEHDFGGFGTHQWSIATCPVDCCWGCHTCYTWVGAPCNYRSDFCCGHPSCFTCPDDPTCNQSGYSSDCRSQEITTYIATVSLNIAV